jgi:hypothetical protein
VKPNPVRKLTLLLSSVAALNLLLGALVINVPSCNEDPHGPFACALLALVVALQLVPLAGSAWLLIDVASRGRAIRALWKLWVVSSVVALLIGMAFLTMS